MNLHNGAMTGNRQFLIFINYTTKYSPPTQSSRFSQTQRDWFVEASKISSTVIWQRGKASFKWNQIVNIRRGEVQKSEQSLNSREVFSFTLWHLNDFGNHICEASFLSYFSHLESTDDAKNSWTIRERLRKDSLEIRLHVLSGKTHKINFFFALKILHSNGLIVYIWIDLSPNEQIKCRSKSLWVD